MDDQWPEIRAAVQSSDPDQVNDALDQIDELDQDDRLQLFEHWFEDLTSIYAESDDGYVRQSAVRVLDRVTPGIATAFMIVETDENGVDDPTVADIETKLDTACGFLLEALQDDDGRVRQSAKRAMKDVFRGYELLEDTETIAALAEELDDLAAKYDDKRRDHLLDAKEDAEFFLRPVGSRMMGELRQAANRTDRM